MRDLHNNLKVKTLLAMTAITADTDTDSVDILGFDALELLVSFGTAANTLSGSVMWQVIVEESADDLTFTVVDTAAHLLFTASPLASTPVATTGIVATFDADAEEDSIVRIGYVGTKRYVRIALEETGDTGDSIFSVIAVRGHPKAAPGLDVAADINL